MSAPRWLRVGLVVALAGGALVGLVGSPAGAVDIPPLDYSAHDDFTGGSGALNGRVLSPDPGRVGWVSESGLSVGSDSAIRTTTNGWARAATNLTGPDGSTEFDVTYTASPPAAGVFISLGFRIVTSGAGWSWQIHCGGSGANSVLYKNGEGGSGVVADPAQAYGVSCSGTHNYRVEYHGDNFELFIDDVLRRSYVSTYPDEISDAVYASGFGIYDDASASSAGVRVDNFRSLTVEPAVPMPLPQYACGRTIRDVGGGAYFVDLEAGNLQDIGKNNSGAYKDDGHYWLTSWGTLVTTPDSREGQSKVTVALPSLSTMPAGGWTATFAVWREDLTGKTFTSFDGQAGGGTHSLDEDGDMAAPVKPWWVHAAAWAAWQAIPENWRNDVDVTEDEDWYLPKSAASFENAGVAVEPSAGFKKIKATCTITIDPTRPAAPNMNSTTGADPVNICSQPPAGPGTTTTTIAACSTGTTTTSTTINPVSGVDDQGEDGKTTDCSAGFLGRLPIIGGAFELATRLVCAFKQLLIELFVPDDIGNLVDLGEFSGRFPMSWVSEGSDSVTSFKNSISTAANGSACGPVMELPAPMNMTVRFPGPSGCGATVAGASESTDAAAFNLFGYRSGLRALLTLFMYLGVLWRLIRLTPWLGGKDDGAPNFDN